MDDAEMILREMLNEYGLGALSGRLYEYMVNGRITEDMTDDQKLMTLKDTDEYKQRFKANELRRQRGLFELKPSEIVATERALQATLSVNQMPRSFYDSTDDFANFIAADVSAAELQQRLDAGYNAIQQANPEAVRQMRELYGVTEPELAAYFLDPEKTTPILQRKARSATIGAEARLQAGMQLTQQQAESIEQAGFGAEQARQGFTQIANEQELYTPIAGEQGAISTEEQIGSTFGTSAAAAQRVATRRRRRRAEFEAGGGFATGQRGVAGLGTTE